MSAPVMVNSNVLQRRSIYSKASFRPVKTIDREERSRMIDKYEKKENEKRKERRERDNKLPVISFATVLLFFAVSFQQFFIVFISLEKGEKRCYFTAVPKWQDATVANCYIENSLCY